MEGDVIISTAGAMAVFHNCICYASQAVYLSAASTLNCLFSQL